MKQDSPDENNKHTQELGRWEHTRRDHIDVAMAFTVAYTRRPESRLPFFRSHRCLMLPSTRAMSPVAT